MSIDKQESSGEQELSGLMGSLGLAAAQQLRDWIKARETEAKARETETKAREAEAKAREAEAVRRAERAEEELARSAPVRLPQAPPEPNRAWRRARIAMTMLTAGARAPCPGQFVNVLPQHCRRYSGSPDSSTTRDEELADLGVIDMTSAVVRQWVAAPGCLLSPEDKTLLELELPRHPIVEAIAGRWWVRTFTPFCLCG